MLHNSADSGPFEAFQAAVSKRRRWFCGRTASRRRRSAKTKRTYVLQSVLHPRMKMCYKFAFSQIKRVLQVFAEISEFLGFFNCLFPFILAAPVTGCGAVRSRYNVERGRFAAWAAPPLRRSDHGCKHHQRDVQRFTGGNRNHRPFAGEEGMTTANRDLAKKKPGHPGK